MSDKNDLIFSKQEFETLSPRERGYVVYMFGERPDQPNVPNEKNPYFVSSREFHEWEEGQLRAILEVQDSDG